MSRGCRDCSPELPLPLPYRHLPQVLPTMDAVIKDMATLAVDFAEVPMLARTHGQTASPTTLGKEMAVFAHRLKRQRDQVRMCMEHAACCSGLDTLPCCLCSGV